MGQQMLTLGLAGEEGFVPLDSELIFQPKIKKSMQQILILLQLNLFEKRDLMSLLRGDPLNDKQANNNQMALL